MIVGVELNWGVCEETDWEVDGSWGVYLRWMISPGDGSVGLGCT